MVWDLLCAGGGLVRVEIDDAGFREEGGPDFALELWWQEDELWK